MSLPITLIAGMLLCASQAQGLELAPRTILATGDVIPGFGAVGRGGFDLIGITDDGSVVVLGTTSNDERGVYRVHDGDAVPLWIVAKDGPDLGVEGADASPNGRVSIVGSQSLYRVDENGGVAIARARDRDADGNTICRFGSSRIDDDGNVAFSARISSEADCSTPRWAAFLLRAGQLQRILDGVEVVDVDLTNAFIGVVDLPGDGSVTLRTNGSVVERGLWSWRDGELDALITDATLDPEGGTRIYQAAAAGTSIAFTAGSATREPSIYRYHNGSLTTILRFGDSGPGGVRISTVQGLHVNQAGDIALNGSQDVFVFPNDDEPYAITAAGGGHINARGDVAVHYWADRIALRNPGRRAVGVKPQGVDAVVTQIASGDAAPGGLTFATGGAGNVRCFGSDGRVAVTVTAADGRTGLACIDDDGPTLVAQGGSSTLDGGSLYEFDQCELAGDGALLLGASELRPDPKSARHYYLDWSVFRAGPAGLERRAGPGSRTEDGSKLKGLRSVILVQRERVFAANTDGDILVFGQTGHEMGLFHVTPDGSITRLPVPFAGSLGGRGTGWSLPENPSVVRGNGAAGAAASTAAGQRFSLEDYVLTDDDSVVFIAEYKREGEFFPDEGLFLFKDGRLTRIASSEDDGSLFSESLRSLRNLKVHGNTVTFSGSSQGKRWYVLTTESPMPVEIAGEGSLPDELVDFTADGRYLFGRWQSATHLLDNNDIDELHAADGILGAVVAMNARGNVLLGEGEGRLLQLHGPAPSAACDFPPPHENEPTVTPTPTITLTPTITWTRRPTGTPQNTWTPTSTPTPVPPIPCDDEAGCPRVSAGSTNAAAGEIVDLVVTIDVGERSVAGLQFDLHIPAPAVVQGSAEQPDCRTDIELDKDVHFAEKPCGNGDGCTTVRALVVSMTDVDAIEVRSVRFLCKVLIPSDAAPDSLPLSISHVFLGTPGGRKLETRVEDGELIITAPEPAPTNTLPAVAPTSSPEPAAEPAVSTEGPGQSRAVSAGGNGGGCSLSRAPQGATWSSGLLLAPFAVLMMLRRLARSMMR